MHAHRDNIICYSSFMCLHVCIIVCMHAWFSCLLSLFLFYFSWNPPMWALSHPRPRTLFVKQPSTFKTTIATSSLFRNASIPTTPSTSLPARTAALRSIVLMSQRGKSAMWPMWWWALWLGGSCHKCCITALWHRQEWVGVFVLTMHAS